jgi:hypothetical protein
MTSVSKYASFNWMLLCAHSWLGILLSMDRSERRLRISRLHSIPRRGYGMMGLSSPLIPEMFWGLRWVSHLVNPDHAR